MGGRRVPRIVREAFRRMSHVAFLDESEFFRTPTVQRTLAPRGRMPVLAAWDRRDRLSAISAITRSPVATRPNPYFEVNPHTIYLHRAGDGVPGRPAPAGASCPTVLPKCPPRKPPTIPIA